MKIESCTTPKYRDLSQPGDDILVVLPQCLYAVFDGATDTAGVMVQGESPGRLAARQAALAMVRYASAPDHVQASAHELMQAMNQSIARGLAAAGAGSVRAASPRAKRAFASLASPYAPMREYLRRSQAKSVTSRRPVLCATDDTVTTRAGGSGVASSSGSRRLVSA